METLWSQLYAQCMERWAAQGLCSKNEWKEFKSRLDSEFVRYAELLWSLYGKRPDFAYQLEDSVKRLFESFCERPEQLKLRDRTFTPESGWFLSEEQIGAVAYVDRFAGSFQALRKRLPYLQELGISYLHLMPFFECPKPENDGGYAVSSYRHTDPALGSMKDLEQLAADCANAGICLVADFIFNHTSDEHEWALNAKAGNPAFQSYYWVFADQGKTEEYQQHLRDIFPEVRHGSFTYVEEMGKWVWTSFHSYQWDLNYRNPELFKAMTGEMMYLANRGISILRLDAVAFIWKEAGTNCENRKEAHTIIQAFQAAARLVAPSLLFKSEAIVHPDDILSYIDLRECQLSYNPLLMAELWEAAATKEVRLLAHSLAKRHSLPAGCSWINYVRCHDDIGWTFANEDAAELGIHGADHRNFLNSFYMGEFPGSFSRGVSFQHNPQTGDRRICGTAASLAGIEQALEKGSTEDLERSVRRVLMLYGIAYAAGGIPLLYLGDELGTLNRYEYADDPSQASDSRWVHRPLWSDAAAEARYDTSNYVGKIFCGLKRMAEERKKHAVFSRQDLQIADSGHPSVLAFHKQMHKGNTHGLLTVLANFSEATVYLSSDKATELLSGQTASDLLSGNILLPGEGLELVSCSLFWLYTEIPQSEQ